MIKDYDKLVEKNHNSKWYMPDHPYKNLINGDPKLDKTNASLNLIKPQWPSNADNICL